MKDHRGWVIGLLLAVVLVACQTAAPADTEAPRIVSTTPADSATGVTKTAKITVQFSEPMDVVSTQAAYLSDSEGIKPDQVTFTWEDTGKRLIITPRSPLAYSPNDEYKTYAFTISTAATDKAGNPLAAAKSVSFSTLRTLNIELEGEAALDGSVSIGGNVMADGNEVLAGYLQDDFMRGFFSFPLKDLPADTESIIWAIMEIYSLKYDDYLGSDECDIELIDYGDSLGGSDYGLPGMEKITVQPKHTGWTTYVLTDWVQQRFAAGAEHFQVRFDFLGDTGAGTDVGYTFQSANASSNRPVLKIAYYGP